MQYWFYLAVAIALEVAATVAMHSSGGFIHLVPSILIFLFLSRTEPLLKVYSDYANFNQ